MKDEIKEILDRLERIDHKEYSCAFEFADSATFDEMARCFEERKKMADYITNLQEERDFYKCTDSMNMESNIELRDRIDKAIEYINTLRKNYFNRCVVNSNKDLGKIIDILQGENDDRRNME